MRPILAALALAALAATALVAPRAGAVYSCGGQNDTCQCGRANPYPCCDNGGGKAGNCTWWAWESACCGWGYGMPGWGNANTWAAEAKANPDLQVLGSPVVGSIACRDAAAPGHVAWVTAVNGSTVTVTEENCCGGCNDGMRTATYQASYFTGGFIVRAGSQCACSAGQTQTEACGDCGTRSRGCDGCNWQGWSGCGGPDPDGGNQVCDTGAPGACGEGRVRCLDGVTSCQGLTGPTPEVCDGIDNDCNGEVDDGHPPVGSPPPAFAAELVDSSYPPALRSGEPGMVWAEFRNVGASPWTKGGLWLHAAGAAGGKPSQLGTMNVWPAWDVAAVLDRDVAPGEVGRFSFPVMVPEGVGPMITESFQLEQPGGAFITCPSAAIAPQIRVLPGGDGRDGSGGAGGAGGAPAATSPGASKTSGCSMAAAPSPPDLSSLLGAGLAAVALSIGRRRRTPLG